MVAQALAGDLEAAGHGLEVATTLCPAAATAWRELGGVRFRQSRWAEAAQSAASAARLEPDDPSGWDLLATSQYLDGRPMHALRSWNRLDRPRVDVVRVSGPHRTPDPVIVGALDLAPRMLLTPERLARAARRLADLPSLTFGRLRYQPLDDGRADVEAVVVEAPVARRGVVAFAAIAAHAAIHREVRLDVASPTGSGERWSAGWRWWHDRPRVTFSVATPSPSWLPGVSAVEGLWERSAYAVATTGSGTPVLRLERRRVGLAIGDWATSRLRWRGTAALDRWADDNHASAGGELDLRVADDHLAFGAGAAAWVPLGTGSRFFTATISVTARSRTSGGLPRWWARGGVSEASAAAPLALWSGAGLGRARAPLLRAHPLLDGGLVAGPIFGRRLLDGTVEHQRTVIEAADGALGLAAFLDAARAWHRPWPGPAWHADAGVGLRLALPADAGLLRLDIARGLRDRGYVVSAGWHTASRR